MHSHQNFILFYFFLYKFFLCAQCKNYSYQFDFFSWQNKFFQIKIKNFWSVSNHFHPVSFFSSTSALADCPHKQNLQGSRRKWMSLKIITKVHFLQTLIRAYMHENAYLYQLLRQAGRCFLSCLQVFIPMLQFSFRHLLAAVVNGFASAIV